MKKTLTSVLLLLVGVFTLASTAIAQPSTSRAYIICIDPGHQLKGNNELEPIGPGATAKKPKVSSGTRGVATKKPEYVLNLEISMKLKKELQKRGYQVVMTRETHNVNVSNKQRSDIANKAKADLFIRIHADGDNSPKTEGFSVLYPSEKNKYTKAIYAKSKTASGLIYKGMKSSTKAKARGVVPRADLTGFNWSKVPVTLVEAGFMTNPNEDKRMSQTSYQDLIVKGISNGVDQYFKK